MLSLEMSRSRQWAYWTLLGLFLSLVFLINDFLTGFKSDALTILWGIGCAYLMALVWVPIARCARVFPLDRWRNTSLHLLLSLVLGLIGSFFFTGLLYVIRTYIHGIPVFDFNRSFPAMVNYFFFAFVTYYWVVIATDRAFFFFNAFRQEELRRVEMSRELTEAQLQALRSQLQPHFLFNTFNSIAALIRTGRSNDGLDTLLQLGSLLRFSLDAGERAMITLKEELSFLRNFMAIEERRFSDRLIFTLAVAEEAEGVMVPAMILQPLLENAIKHGLEEDPEAGKISLTINLTENRLNIDLYNEGPTLRRSHREGVGLSNTRRRLQHRYGGDFEFDIRDDGDSGVRVTLSFPVNLPEEVGP